MKQPYIYTLPEQFIKDASVPTRWRVWAVINGFFVGGKTCWASNDWIGEQISAHKDTVSQAIKELEDMGLMTCKRTARTRLISPVDPMIGTTAYLRSVPPPISDRHHRLSTSVSNSVNTSSVAEPRVEVVENEDKPPTKNSRSKEKRQVFSFFSKRSEPWMQHTTQKSAALRLYDRGLDKLKRGLDIMRENESDQFCPKAYTPWEYEQKLPKLKAYAKKNNL